MKTIFKIEDASIVNQMLDEAEYGTLALCADNKPYSLPINFMYLDDVVYFHGAKRGRKIDILKVNTFASFSVVESYSLIQSYFSSSDGLACPATQFFKSVIIDGQIEFVEDYDEKVTALTTLMKKHQPEGEYRPLSEDVYTKAVNATTLYKLVPKETSAKFKFGQNLTIERFDMIVEHLRARGSEKDLATVQQMLVLKKSYNI